MLSGCYLESISGKRIEESSLFFCEMDLSSEDFEFEEEFPNEDFDPRTGYM